MPDAEKLRCELDEIGERRKRVGREIVSLAKDTGKAIRKARGTITMTEIAQRVGIDRSNLYHTYGGDF